MKVMVILFVLCALGTIDQILGKRLKELKIKGKIETIQTKNITRKNITVCHLFLLYIYIYIYIRRCPGRPGFNSRSTHVKDSKMVFDRIIKYGSRMKWSNALPYTSV